MKSTEEIINRIFIVGVPRSGTTFLQQLMVSNFDVISFPETHFFSIAHPRNPIKHALTWPALNVQRLTKKLVKQLGYTYTKRYNVCLFQSDYFIPFVKLLDDIANSHGKKMWLEKTPGHLYHIEDIEKINNVKFIHLIRNGEDVVTSLYEATNIYKKQWRRKKYSFFKGLTLDETIHKWNSGIHKSMMYVTKKNHLIIFYDDLVLEEEKQLNKIKNFLGVGELSKNLSFEDAAQLVIDKDNEPWKKNNYKKKKHETRKFDNFFSQEKKDYIKTKLDYAAYEKLKKMASI